jgi:putative chitinase
MQQFITAEQLAAFYPKAINFADELDAAAQCWGIDTAARIAMWLAQCAHESADFTKTAENLNYSEQGLLANFPAHFKNGSAATYAHQPEKIANRVYAGRMGNGDEGSGDGWLCRGQGLIQLTGRANFTTYFKECGWRIAAFNPGLLQLPEHAANSAGWFWAKHGLNAFADRRDLPGCTRIIHGSSVGPSAEEPQRGAKYIRAEQIWH